MAATEKEKLNAAAPVPAVPLRDCVDADACDKCDARAVALAPGAAKSCVQIDKGGIGSITAG